MSLPRLSLFDSDPAESAVDAVVLGVHSHDRAGELLVASGAESITAAFDGQLTDALRVLGATGAAGEVVKLATLGTIAAPLVVAVGLGPVPAGAGCDLEVLRRGAGAAVRAAGGGKVALALPVPDDDTAPQAVRAVAEGALLGAYRFAGYKQSQPDRTISALMVHVPETRDRALRAEVRRASTVAAAVARTRDWVNTPPNLLRPPDFAEQVAEAASEAGLAVDVLDERALRRGGYGGILAVGQGSAAPPRLVRLEYAPARGRSTARVALVGKGITFDTGGVSIKPSQGMWEMTSDMSGAAAVAATLIALAALKPKLTVTAYLPMAENMPSGTAYRPGDVVRMYNGKQVEVLNTDAEGRLILADAIARACEDEPDYLIETSTLTGAQIVALGKRVAGVMGDPDLCERVRRAGEVAGEQMWPMPMPDDVRSSMDSAVADILQTAAGLDRSGSMLQGAWFLSEFVTPDLPWAHIDIAGPAYHTGEPYGYVSKGGTGVPVRTLLQLLEDLADTGPRH